MTVIKQNRWKSARSELRTRRANREARKALVADLAAFDSPNALVELAAILDRHADADTADIRRLVDVTAAA